MKLPMTESQAAQFAFDWPVWPFSKPRCNLCGRQYKLLDVLPHLNGEHPGWLDQWNDALRSAGLDEVR